MFFICFMLFFAAAKVELFFELLFTFSFYFFTFQQDNVFPLQSLAITN